MEKINTYCPIPQSEVEKLKDEITLQYNTYLKDFGVKLPDRNTNMMLWLVYLYKNIGKAVHKDVISNFVQKYNPKASGDQQVRHLSAQRGFYVLGKGKVFNNETMPLGYYLLVSLTEADPGWVNNETKRKVTLTTDDFEIIKHNFNYCCASCGVKEGTIHPRTNTIVTLQKGHINPGKPLEVGNIIPQCEYCNQNIYKNDFIFTPFGYPDSIYNPKYILKSNESVQREVYEILKAKFKVD